MLMTKKDYIALKKQDRTDIFVVQEARYCPASLEFCLKNQWIVLKYIPRHRLRLLNIDFDTK